MSVTELPCCADVRGSECHCAGCHQSFTCMALFDLHQDVDYSRDEPVICGLPQALGLVQDARHVWGTPEGLRARERHTTTLARARSARSAA